MTAADVAVPGTRPRTGPPPAGPPPVRPSRWPSARRVLPRPLLLGAVLLALWAAMATRALDSIEQRVLNWPFVSLRIADHLLLTGVSTLLVVVIAVPLGILLTRRGARRLTPVAVNVANIGQATPAVGVLVLLALVLGIGLQPALVALVAYSVLPVLRNTMVGLQQVDPALVDAGRGLGMTPRGLLTRVELPLAVPVILAGIRTALVINVGTATLATFVNAGGLGDLIVVGIATQRLATILLTGSVLVAVLALLIDWLAGLAEDVLRPRGLA